MSRRSIRVCIATTSAPPIWLRFAASPAMRGAKIKCLLGGALARWWGTACELQQIWVDEALRRRGIGASLMQQVEATAIEHGCHLIYLDTFSFQAPEFYYRLGYQTACRFDGFPDGGRSSSCENR